MIILFVNLVIYLIIVILCFKSEKTLDDFCLKNHWKKQENGEINLKDQFDNSKLPEVLEKQVGQLTEMVSFMEKLN